MPMPHVRMRGKDEAQVIYLAIFFRTPPPGEKAGAATLGFPTASGHLTRPGVRWKTNSPELHDRRRPGFQTSGP